MYNSVMQDPHAHKSDYSMDLVLNAQKVQPQNNYMTVNKKNVMVVQNAQHKQ